MWTPLLLLLLLLPEAIFSIHISYGELLCPTSAAQVQTRPELPGTCSLPVKWSSFNNQNLVCDKAATLRIECFLKQD